MFTMHWTMLQSCIMTHGHASWYINVIHDVRSCIILRDHVPWYTRYMIIHDDACTDWLGVFDRMDCSRARIKPICAMLNSVWTTVGGINSCTTHDAWYGVVARCPFPPPQCWQHDGCRLAVPHYIFSFAPGTYHLQHWWEGKGDSVGKPGYSEAWIANSGSGTGINSPDVRDMGRQPSLIAVWHGILVRFCSACGAWSYVSVHDDEWWHMIMWQVMRSCIMIHGHAPWSAPGVS